MTLGFYRLIFEKSSNLKFQQNPPVGAELVHADRRMVRHDVANSRRFSQYCESAYNSLG